jgi:lipid A 4'-phosphatase
MSVLDPYTPQETKFRREFLVGTALLAVPLAVVLVANPGIDLAISSALREACPVAPALPGRPWCQTATIDVARRAFQVIFVLLALSTLIAAVRLVIAERKWFGLAQARCWFMIAVLVIGPGVVANLVFKDNMGRARPRDVVEFGGTKAFSPPLLPSGECPRNCSFVSGEASAMFAPFFALALVLPQYRLGLLAAGLATGLLAGTIRMVQGAHFLSDILFAGIFMALTVALLHIAFIGVWRNPRRTWNAFAAPFTPLMRVAAARMR